MTIHRCESRARRRSRRRMEKPSSSNIVKHATITGTFTRLDVCTDSLTPPIRPIAILSDRYKLCVADSDGDDDESDDDLNRHLAMPIDRYINTYTHIRTGHHGRTTAVCATIVLKPSTTIARGLEHALARYDDLTLETCTHTHTHTYMGDCSQKIPEETFV